MEGPKIWSPTHSEMTDTNAPSEGRFDLEEEEEEMMFKCRVCESYMYDKHRDPDSKRELINGDRTFVCLSCKNKAKEPKK